MLILTRRIGECLIIGGAEGSDKKENKVLSNGNNGSSNTHNVTVQATDIAQEGASTSIVLDDTVINVKVLGVKGCQVRLGIEAPKHISVHREEIYRRIQQEKQSSYTAVAAEERKAV